MLSEQKDMLLKEYDELASHMRTFWMIRASVLGVGLTFIGMMFKLSVESNAPFNHVFYLGLLFLVIALIKMTGSLTRSLYIFSFRLEEISRQFKVQNFWGIWAKHAALRSNDSGSYPYLLIMYFLNGLVFLFVTGSCLMKIIESHQNMEGFGVTAIVFFLAPVLSAYSHYSVKREIDPSDFKDFVHVAWRKSHEEAYPERGGD